MISPILGITIILISYQSRNMGIAINQYAINLHGNIPIIWEHLTIYSLRSSVHLGYIFATPHGIDPHNYQLESLVILRSLAQEICAQSCLPVITTDLN